MAWLVVAVLAWLVTVPASLPPGKPAAYVTGAVLASLIFPGLIRIGWTRLVRSGPQVWERALYSPWLWVVAAVFNILATSGRQSPG